MDMEEHVCQSCGRPVSEKDMVGGSEQGDFCGMCMVHNDFVVDKAQAKSMLADQIQKDSGKSRGDAEKEAEDTMSKLKRWQ